MKLTPENSDELTIGHAQGAQPWVVPYSEDFEGACFRGMPHLRATHAVLHAMKSLGKVATVLEALDHSERGISDDQRRLVEAMAADLFTVALRLANLYGFSLAAKLVARVREKNGVDLLKAERHPHDCAWICGRRVV